MLKLVKDTLKRNMFILGLHNHFRNYDHNKRVFEFAQMTSVMDLFCDSEIIEYNKQLHSIKKQGSDFIAYNYLWSESLLYGNMHTIFKYAGLSLKDAIYFPIIEHGVVFLDHVRRNLQESTLGMGPYRREVIHKKHPNMPVFLSGPYIHYADNFYSDEQRTALKHRWGKTLLLIPQHTYEYSEAEYDMKKYLHDIMSSYAPKYNTVAACLYWKDFDSRLYELLRAEGIEIVTAGYRWNHNFLEKLKTIISLADGVVSNSLGSHIGYSLYLNKTLYHIDTNTQIREKGVIESIAEYDRLKRLFLQNMDLHEQNRVCEPYWGFSHIKTREEIKDIMHICKKIIQTSHGNYSGYLSAAHKLGKHGLTETQQRLLLDAMGIVV